MENSLQASATRGASPTASDVTIVVCTRDRAEMLAAALAAILRATRSAEIVVVDSASTTTSTRDVAEAAGVRYIRSDVPGLSIARNLGLAAADRPIVVFTDDDCVVDPGFLSPLIAPFADAATVGVTGRLRDHDDRSAATPPTVDVLTRVADGLDAGHGALMAFRRDSVLASGGFDPVLGAGRRFGGAEDLDMFCRILTGGRLVRVSAAAVTHVNTRDDDDYTILNAAYGRGLGAMLAKWRRTHPGSSWTLLGIVIRRAAVGSFRRARTRRGRAAQRAYVAGLLAGFFAARRRPVDGENLVDTDPPEAVPASCAGVRTEEVGS
ncbi:glycosyltransferase [Microbacterium luteum]|uniref:glycosyltransferase n=1 Tax=Microbacterium luteum TaxID=2782167 RepID=UPI0018895442|nr:glycosyltransferase [Microbacterium luteum]